MAKRLEGDRRFCALWSPDRNPLRVEGVEEQREGILRQRRKSAEALLTVTKNKKIRSTAAAGMPRGLDAKGQSLTKPQDSGAQTPWPIEHLQPNKLLHDEVAQELGDEPGHHGLRSFLCRRCSFSGVLVLANMQSALALEVSRF